MKDKIKAMLQKGISRESIIAKMTKPEKKKRIKAENEAFEKVWEIITNTDKYPDYTNEGAFTRVHSEVQNGGFDQLRGNLQDDVELNKVIANAQGFTQDYAADSAVEFEEITEKVVSLIANEDESNLDTELDKLDYRYYDLMPDLEASIGKNYNIETNK